ncbi:MAG: hypothetical protein MUF48_25035 [Pirellulaceae bacterium]|nr:hypothetical protein [Pirellulaceae bacterium]
MMWRSHAIELTFLVAEELARQDPSWAGRVYAALSQPFAVYAFEQERITTAHGVAYQIGREALLETVELLEPWVPWTERFLAARSEIYARTSHPRAARALRDLQAFRQAAR